MKSRVSGLAKVNAHAQPFTPQAARVTAVVMAFSRKEMSDGTKLALAPAFSHAEGFSRLSPFFRLVHVRPPLSYNQHLVHERRIISFSVALLVRRTGGHVQRGM